MTALNIDEQWLWVFTDATDISKRPGDQFIEYVYVIAAILSEQHDKLYKNNPNREFNRALESFTNSLRSSTDIEGQHGMDMVRAAYHRRSLPEKLLAVMATLNVEKINGLPKFVNAMFKQRQIFICDIEADPEDLCQKKVQF